MTSVAIDSMEFTRVLIYTTVSFLIGIWWGPYLIRLLRWLRFWKKESRKVSMVGQGFDEKTLKKFYEHDESKMKIPRGGGILIWMTTLVLAAFFWILLKIEPNNKSFQFLNFVNRTQTFIPLGTLFFGAILGFVDDALSTLESGGNYHAGGLKLSQRVGLISALSIAIGIWFYTRLNIHIISIFSYKLNLYNLFGLNLGWLIVPITLVVLLALWGSSVIDGFDGLSGGTFIPIFICFAGIAYTRGFYDIATLMGVLAGAIMAFLWFNISPAKFYMGDTGSAAVLLTLGVVAILIDAIYILPIAGIMLVLTVGSNVVQIFSRKVFKRKVLRAAPIHHHFEAMGMKREQVVLRYWIISIAMSTTGLALALLLK
jgi:phospho-N-acetylmuramoyl-pentapeptide-transferase